VQASARGAAGKGSYEHGEAELLPTNTSSRLQPKAAVAALGPEEPRGEGHVPGDICCP